MENTIIQVPCELVKAEMRALTKDAKLTFNTQQEVPPELLTQIIGKTGKTGWLSFLTEERPIEPEDVIDLPEIKRLKEEKSPSARLRAILFLVWKNEGEVGQFETWYAGKIGQLCEHFKKQLPKE